MSRNTLAIHTMKQDVQLQKVNQEPNLNNDIMKIMVDMWDNNKVNQNIKKDSSSNMLNNNTMENKCVQLKRNNNNKYNTIPPTQSEHIHWRIKSNVITKLD